MATENKDFKVKHGLSVNGGASFGSSISIGEATADTHAATKGYVDTQLATFDQFLDPLPVVAATTTNINLGTALAIGQTIDGVPLSDGTRVLVKNQTNQSENGIYVVTTGTPLRDPNFNSASNIFPGCKIFVLDGTINNGSTFNLKSTVINVGVAPLVFQFLGPLKAGTGITIDDNNNISVNPEGGFATIIFDEQTNTSSLTADIIGSSLQTVGTLDSLSVFGTTTLQDNVNITGTISATGKATFDSLEVTGQVDLKADIEIDGGLSVLGQMVIFDNDLEVYGNSSFEGTTSFQGAVTVLSPTQGSNPATKDYVDNLLNQESVEITTIDDLSNYFNGFESRFRPTYQGIPVTLQNPFNLLLTIDGIIQSVGYPDYVWQSVMPRVGFRIDNDGYIAFPEPIPQGSSFDARVLVGSNVTQQTKVYPFKAMDIVLGGY